MVVLATESYVRKVCKRKATYPIELDADLHVAQLWASAKHDVSIYRCCVCKKWHITSQKAWSDK